MEPMTPQLPPKLAKLKIETSLPYMEKFRRANKQNDYLHPWVAAKYGYIDGFDACAQELLPLLQEMREALEFYANEKNWKSPHGNGGGVDDQIINDCEKWIGGTKAREALAKIKEKLE